MDKFEEEKEFLKNVYSSHVTKPSMQTKVLRELTFRTLSRYLNSESSVLELGCSDGYLTQKYAMIVKEIDVVDGSDFFISMAKERIEASGIQNVTFYTSLFETFESSKRYDVVVASFILEHVLEPLDVLRMARNVLKDDGLLLVVVPNANALSRQLALEMGLYKDLKELTEHDYKVGHRRVYDREALTQDIENAGFESIEDGGIMVKILADFQLDQLYEHGILQERQIEGLYRLGLKYPDLCGGIYSICKKSK